MKFILPFILFLSHGCIKKVNQNADEMRVIDRDTDILDEEDLEELPES